MTLKSIPGSGMEIVIERCGRGEEIRLDSSTNIDNLVDRLCFVNFCQWHLEDALHDPSLTPEKALELVRALQSSNIERIFLIEQIDRYLMDARGKDDIIVAPQTELGFHETLGQLLDSLSIAYIRKYHMERLLVKDLFNHPHSGYKISDAVLAIKKQIVLIEHTYLRVQNMFMCGEIDLPPFSRFKMYRLPE